MPAACALPATASYHKSISSAGQPLVQPLVNSLSISCRLKVEEYQQLTPDSFTERYTALVQRLSLMLLQVR
jgi:hypothetical protein